MELLPPEEDRAWLFDAIAGLVERRGYEPLAVAPLLEPTGAFFPDVWTPDDEGVEVVTRRLLRYAGLETLSVALSSYPDGPEPRPGGCQAAADGTPAWFEELRDGELLIGVDPERLEDSEAVVAALCHAVAHAYRVFHGIGVAELHAAPGAYRDAHHVVMSNEQIEEELTDVTSVYLGFGILSTNASLRHRSSGRLTATLVTFQVSSDSTGTLSPQAMSWLLAGQVVARQLAPGERRRVAAQLETNQAACFKAACAALDGELREALGARLGLPDAAVWPAPPSLEHLAGPLRARSKPPRAVPAPPEKTRRNEGEIVFRVRRTKAVSRGGLGLLAGMALGTAAQVSIDSGWLTTALVLATTGAGVAIGKKLRDDFCSDPDCEASIASDEERCPGCGASVRGEIASPADRLEALEDVEESDRRSKAKRSGNAKGKRKKARAGG